jgi:hypothetical protein
MITGNVRNTVCCCTVGLALFTAQTAPASGFEGAIRAWIGPANEPVELLYTVGTNFMRLERTGTNSAYAINVVDLRTGEITFIRPDNKSFMRLSTGDQNPASRPRLITPRVRHFVRIPLPGPSGVPPGGLANLPGSPEQIEALPGIVGQPSDNSAHGPANLPTMPMPSGGMPPDIGPASGPPMPGLPNMPIPPEGLPPGIGPQGRANAMPAMTAMRNESSMLPIPMIPTDEGLELKATGQQTNLLSCVCNRFEIKQAGQTMEIWATDQLVPFQPYLPVLPASFAPPTIGEQWGRLVAAKRLFPLSAILRLDSGQELYRFEVHSITPAKLSDREAAGFQPPVDYVEVQMRPF